MQPLVINPKNDTAPDSNDAPALPAELVSKIILELQQDRQYAVLAEMALANSTFYGLVIPKLYETVTITSRNKYSISHGTHPPRYDKWTHWLDTDGYVITDPDQPPYVYMKTRKDRAIEWCRRLIIDTPSTSFVDTIEYITDLLPHHRCGNVEELILTRRVMIDPEYDQYTCSLSEILPPVVSIGTREQVCDQLPRTKRVVIHMADVPRYDWILSSLSVWCRQRRNFRKLPQFAIHDLHLGFHRYYIDHMNVDYHFSHYGTPAGSFGSRLARWLLITFPLGGPISFPKLNLFGVYRFLMTDEELSQDPSQASQQARSIIETDLGSAIDVRVGIGLRDKAELIRGIMARITFHEAEYEDVYPTSTPIPVSYCE